MLTRIFRQRRRLISLGFSFGLAAFGAPGLPPLVGAAALTGLGLGVLVLWLAPRQRALLDSIGLALAGLAFLPVPTIAVPLLLPLGAAAAHGLLYGSSTDRLGLRIGLKSRARITLAHPAERIWQALVPGEGHPDDDLSGTLVDFDTDPEDDLTLYLRHVNRAGVVEETTVTFLDRQAPRRCDYMLDQSSGNLPDEAEVSIRLDPAGADRTTVHLSQRQSALPPRLALGRWLDDVAGDRLDSLRAQLAGAADWSINRLPLDTSTPPVTIQWPQGWPNPPKRQVL